METKTTLNFCNFHSLECKGKIKTITENANIPLTNKEIILVGMKLCQAHYNKLLLMKLVILNIINLVLIQNMIYIKHNQKMKIKNQNLILKKFQQD